MAPPNESQSAGKEVQFSPEQDANHTSTHGCVGNFGTVLQPSMAPLDESQRPGKEVQLSPARDTGHASAHGCVGNSGPVLQRDQLQVTASEARDGYSSVFGQNENSSTTGAQRREHARIRRRFSEVVRLYPSDVCEAVGEFTEGSPTPATIVREREHAIPPSTSGARAQSCTTTGAQQRDHARIRRRFLEVARPYPSDVSETVGECLAPAIIEREREREHAPPPSTSGAQAQTHGTPLPAPHRRRSRWDQPPPTPLGRCCPTGEARFMMTCCQAELCKDCAMVNPCGCRDWQEGRGFPVPMFPELPIPDDCILERPFRLGYPTWLRIYASRVADDVWIVYICLEDLVRRPLALMISQVHCYETVGRSWTRFHCHIYQGRHKIGLFSYPFVSRQDKEDFEKIVYMWRRYCTRR